MVAKALASSNEGIDREYRHTLLTCYGGNNTAGPIEVSSRLGCNDTGGGFRADFESDTFVTEIPATAACLTFGAKVGSHNGQDDHQDGRLLPTPIGVRRLTPVECERLQGFPDDYTLIKYRRKPAKDAPRYHAIGNSMAVPVVQWLGRRIELIEKLCP